MYNLNYTYLTELEVDTRQTFSDLSTDLLLLHNDQNSNDCTFTMKSLVSSWQDFFWKSDNKNKEKLKVTFTDISIERKSSSDLKHDYCGYEIDQDGDEMMSIQELDDYYDTLKNKWVGNKTFSQMTADIIKAITDIHGKFSKNNVYPKGSIVISDINPKGQYGSGTWKEKSASFISENMKATMSSTELKSCGYHGGEAMGTRINGNLNQAIISAKTNGKVVPKHTHQLKFEPESDSGGGSNSTETSGFNVCCDECGIKPGSNSKPFSGQYNENHHGSGSNTATGFIIASDASDTIYEGAEGTLSFNVSNTKVNPNVSSVNFAPKPYSLSAKIWERET